MKHTLRRIILLLFTLLLILTSTAVAHYIGPQRESETIRDPTRDYIELEKVSGPGGVRFCRLDTHCSTDPSPEQQEYWCNSGTLYPNGWCGAHPGSCWSGTVTTRYCYTEEGESDPEATVSSTFTCGTPGSNGWCRGGARVNFSANEPVGGKVITFIEGNPGILCDPADAPSVTCGWTPPEGASTLEFWAHSTYGDTSAKGSRTLQVDTLAPTVSLAVPPPSGQSGWHVANVQASPAANDATSGVQQMQWQIDSQGWRTDYPLSLGEGIHTVQVQATDRAGNTNTTTTTVRVDTTPPTLVVDVPAPDDSDGWYAKPVTLSVSGSDLTSGLASAMIRIDGGAWQASPLVLDQDGVFDVQFRTMDVAGNTTQQTHKLSIDLLGPTLTLNEEGTYGEADWYVSDSVEVTVQAEDGVSGVREVEVRVDDGDWQTTDQVTVIGDGIHTIEVRASDYAGHTSNTGGMFRIDSTPPNISSLIEGQPGLAKWYISPVDVSLVAEDDTAGIAELALRVGDADWQAADRLSLDEDGMYELAFRAKDQAGNLTHDSLTISIDQTAPSGAITLPEIGSLLSQIVQVTGWAEDNLSGLHRVEVSPDGGLTWQAASVTPGGNWSYEWDTLQANGGKQLLHARITDQAGNVTTIQLPVTVANRGPVITLQPRWLVEESGRLVVDVGDVPVRSVQITIRDPLNRWPVLTTNYEPDSYPRAVVWDQHFGTALAPVGEYPVEVIAIDEAGLSARAEAVIVVPEPPTPTPMATSTQFPLRFPTGTARPTKMVTLLPTQTASVTVVSITTGSPTPTLSVTTPIPTMTLPSLRQPTPISTVPEKQYTKGLCLAILSGIGLLLVFAISAALDPRPEEIQRLSKQISRMTHPDD